MLKLKQHVTSMAKLCSLGCVTARCKWNFIIFFNNVGAMCFVSFATLKSDLPRTSEACRAVIWTAQPHSCHGLRGKGSSDMIQGTYTH